MESEDDFLALAKSDTSQLCGELVMLWKLFLDNVNGNGIIKKYLAKIHHFFRVNKFVNSNTSVISIIIWPVRSFMFLYQCYYFSDVKVF